MLCAPKADITKAAKKNTPISKNSNSITKTQRRILKEEGKQQQKKDFTDLESSLLSVTSKQIRINFIRRVIHLS